MSTDLLQVFICHASQDKDAARQLASNLLRDGLDPWLDEDRLLPGQDWETEIRLALKRADAVVVCLSRTSVTKIGFVQKEMRIALAAADERPPGASFLFPARLDDCVIPDRFSHIQVAELSSTTGYDRLLAAFGIQAAALGRLPPKTQGQFTRSEPLEPDLAQLVFAAYRDSFHACIRTGARLKRKQRGVFSISLLGNSGVGKTALTYMLAGGGLDFISSDSEPDRRMTFEYRVRIARGIFVFDHWAPADEQEWQQVVDFVAINSDLAICLHEASRLGSHLDPSALRASGVTLVPAITRIDKVDLPTLRMRIEEVRLTYGVTPLLLSGPWQVGLTELRQFIADARRFYS